MNVKLKIQIYKIFLEIWEKGCIYEIEIDYNEIGIVR